MSWVVGFVKSALAAIIKHVTVLRFQRYYTMLTNNKIDASIDLTSFRTFAN